MAGAALMWVEGEITARKDVVLPSAISVLLCKVTFKIVQGKNKGVCAFKHAKG